MKISVHSSVQTLKVSGIQEQEDFRAVLRAPGMIEITQENIQDWLKLDKGDPVQLLIEEKIVAVIFLFTFVSTTGRPSRKAGNFTAICEPIV
jgi:hypothetical protein